MYVSGICNYKFYLLFATKEIRIVLIICTGGICLATIHNYMEELVRIMIDGVLQDFDVCKCPQCRSDIMAITLNMLPPKYVVTKTGEAYSKTNLLIQQFEVDIITAITKACEIVNKAPRH